MKTATLKTIRLGTLAVVMVMSVGALAQGSNINGYLQSFIAADGVIGRMLVSTGVVAEAKTAQSSDGNAVLAVKTWTGGANNGNWTSNGNWAGVGGAGPDDDLVFSNADFTNDPNNDFAINTRFRSILIDDPRHDITGNQIFLTAGISSTASGGTQGVDPDFSPHIILDANQTFSNGSKELNLNGIINLNGKTLNISTVGGSGNINFNGRINGTGNLNLAGNARIFGDSSAFGPTEIDSGILSVDSPGQLGNVNLNGGTLEGTGTVGAITASATNGGDIDPGLNNNTITRTGILTSTGASVLNAATTLRITIEGTSPGSQFDQLRASGGNINLGGANLVLSFPTITPTVGQQFTIVTQTGTGDLTGQFAQGSLINSSGHIFAIAYTVNGAVLTYQGTTLTWEGSSNSSWNTAANWDSNVAPSIGSAATDLAFPAGAQNLNNTNNIGGLILGSLQFTGAGYQINGNQFTLSEGITDSANGDNTVSINLTLTANQTFSKTVPDRTLRLLGGNLDLGSSSTLTTDGAGNIIASGNILGTNLTLGTVAIEKNGTGTLLLSGAGSTYTGLTRVNAGTLQVGSPSALGHIADNRDKTVVASGASLNITHPTLQNVEDFDLNGAGVSNQGAIFSNSCAPCTLLGDIVIQSNTTIGTPNLTNRINHDGQLFGSSTLTKTGLGTLVFSGPSGSFTGTKSVPAGTVLVNTNHGSSPVSLSGGTIGGSGIIGPLSGNGTVAPGTSAGILTVNGAANLSSATLNIEVNGVTPGTQHDRLVVTGTTNLAGANLTGSLGFNPNGGQQFTIIQSTGAITGQFAQGVSINIGGRQFSIAYNTNSVVLTASGGSRSPFDFDGDGKTDVSIFRPGDGTWWHSRSSDGNVGVVQFGVASDKMTPGDFTGDGKTDAAFFRPSTGQWFVLRSEDFAFFAFPFGTNGDVPVPADYDGDGKTDAAVFRPSNSTWFILRSSDNGFTITNFGSSGDKPVAADYDGDGKADVGIFRPSDGTWWHTRSSDGELRVYQFGNASDRPTPGDFTGDGKADVAFWRPSTGFWFVLRSEDSAFFAFPFGTNGDTPTPGDYDGDGKFDAAVFRPTGAIWFANRSTAGTLIQQFGAPTDLPVPNAFVP